MEKNYINVKGTRIPFWIQNEDFSKVPKLRDSKSLGVMVHYNKTGVVTVDKTADKTYAYYAGAHECICAGCYKNLSPAVKNPNDLCGAIDIMLMEQMPSNYREIYRQKRIQMFKELLDRNMTPELNEKFKRSIEILQNGKVD